MEVLFLTTSCAAFLPTVSNYSIISEHIPSLTGPSSKGRLLDYMEGCSQEISGPNKTVEIDDSKFGRRKFHRGQAVKEQWVFGGI